ncbi:hypothetical protein PUNSTDRAFT_144558 [Punctularia strigosozonata HHB-11173 SS5]|uniref:uncharacterized protein n=1 Tax=Punctularia strigosozonata (strain HHB-11173) TaxID=741275 RepID=UPI0004418434|nr:uncharacterized protein PUNSTDRAFT_144558 [Punctularia strigosozonata HHB-11173 SS5]EIN06963.1 hypothetical protein PUNSTDRAFT_144558 [Punctularia strigosozonata HHB-11173 SS5]
MPRFVVFTGAPSATDLRANVNGLSTCYWRQIGSTEPGLLSERATLLTQRTQPLPIATLEAASRRLSLIYGNAIFDDSSTEDYQLALEEAEDGATAITWLPTEDQDNQVTKGDASILEPSIHHRARSFLDETGYTYDTGSYARSGNHSDESSIALFPVFAFNPHALVNMGSLHPTESLSRLNARRVSFLVAVFEVEGPETIRVKKGVDAGKEVSVLKLCIGDDGGPVAKMVAWREVADTWGGNTEELAVKKGDIVLFENISATYGSTTNPTLNLTASAFFNPRMEICYRTMPYSHEDNRLRPDLRLGMSDMAVRRVAALVEWFERIAGLTVD